TRGREYGAACRRSARRRAPGPPLHWRPLDRRCAPVVLLDRSAGLEPAFVVVSTGLNTPCPGCARSRSPAPRASRPASLVLTGCSHDLRNAHGIGKGLSATAPG